MKKLLRWMLDLIVPASYAQTTYPIQWDGVQTWHDCAGLHIERRFGRRALQNQIAAKITSLTGTSNITYTTHCWR